MLAVDFTKREEGECYKRCEEILDLLSVFGVRMWCGNVPNIGDDALNLTGSHDV
jgi:hypothetical protein